MKSHVYFYQIFILSDHEYMRSLFSSGVAEMLAMEMKSSGMYVSRGLSYIQAEVRLGINLFSIRSVLEII